MLKTNIKAYKNWRPTFKGVVVFFICLALLFFRLSIPSGIAASEKQLIESSSSVKTIIKDPIYSPVKIGLYAVEKLNLRPKLNFYRAVSAFYAALALWCFFVILRHWYTNRIAWIGLLLFGTASWFLHSARLADGNILLLYPLALMAFGLGMMKTKRLEIRLILFLCLISVSVYIPGMIWVAGATLIWQRKSLLSYIGQIKPRYKFLLGLISLLVLSPAIYSLFLVPSKLYLIFGITKISALSDINSLKNLVILPLQFVVRGPDNPLYNVGRLPIVDTFTAAMTALGIYALFWKRQLDRTRLIISMAIFGSLLIAINGTEFITILIPFVYLMATAGVALMVQQWFTVFPKNPVARSLGFIIIVLGISLTSYHNLKSYFIAWPRVNDTISVFDKNSYLIK